jgi:uncharacterized protein
MPSRLRLVFDTNVYIAAVLNPGGGADSWLRHSMRYELYTSPAILEEVRAKLIEKFHLPEARVDRVIEKVTAIAHLVEPQEQIVGVPKDPDDNKILECAVAAEADLIISSDPHLYKLKQFRDIQIKHLSDLKYVFPEVKH